MTARELYEWAAFERTFGPLTVQERVDAAGAIAAFGALAAAGARDVRPEDLLPDWERQHTQPKPQSADEMMALMRTYMRPKEAQTTP